MVVVVLVFNRTTAARGSEIDIWRKGRLVPNGQRFPAQTVAWDATYSSVSGMQSLDWARRASRNAR